MELFERIKCLRNELELKQDDFGKKLNLTKFAISNYENGRTGVPDRVISDICREFDVNETWLRTGEGEMFERLTDQQKVMKYTAMLLKDKESLIANAIKNFIITYEQLDDTSKRVLEDVALKCLENIKKGQ